MKLCSACPSSPTLSGKLIVVLENDKAVKKDQKVFDRQTETISQDKQLDIGDNRYFTVQCNSMLHADCLIV